MQNIIESYRGVKAEPIVKCPCEICQKLAVPTTFFHSKLVEWSRMRENASVTCNESGQQLQISELLFSVGFNGGSTGNERGIKYNTQVITVFLASSSELEDDRKEFETFINRQNKQLHSNGIFLRLEIWEDFIDAMSKTRLQDEYNSVIQKSHIFVSLFWTKVGIYTAEEFSKALSEFQKKGKPLIYTFFKKAPINPNDIKEEDINSKFKFQKELKALGHFPTNYENIQDLELKFKNQLEKVLPSLTL